MVNRRRGEIEAMLDGRPFTLCLTLGALARLESAFGANDLVALAERFETGRFAAGDLIAILAAGLYGGGHDLTREEVAEMRVDGGATTYARIVMELLAVTFGAEEGAEARPPAGEAGKAGAPPSLGTT
jgi:hypothetical protein